jgi:hypothetical protein
VAQPVQRHASHGTRPAYTPVGGRVWPGRETGWNPSDHVAATDQAA